MILERMERINSWEKEQREKGTERNNITNIFFISIKCYIMLNTRLNEIDFFL